MESCKGICLGRLQPWLEILEWAEVTVSDEHSSLLQNGIIYNRKSFRMHDNWFQLKFPKTNKTLECLYLEDAVRIVHCYQTHQPNAEKINSPLKRFYWIVLVDCTMDTSLFVKNQRNLVYLTLSHFPSLTLLLYLCIYLPIHP